MYKQRKRGSHYYIIKVTTFLEKVIQINTSNRVAMHLIIFEGERKLLVSTFIEG
jgi:biotin synthase-related radical SAM superfamily protein